MSPTRALSHPLPEDLARALGANRATRLRRVMRRTQLPAEAALDLALRMLELAAEGLLLEPVEPTAVGLATARWRNVSPEERSREGRRRVQARWEKHRARVAAQADGREGTGESLSPAAAAGTEAGAQGSNPTPPEEPPE